jgi:5-methylcytosine-specific restriction endonuclease McrA
VSKGDPKLKIACHHVIRRRDGGTDELSNLVTLCASCHMRREARYSTALFA